MDKTKAEIISDLEKMIKTPKEKPENKKLFLFFGIPGSGKTTLAEEIAKRYSTTSVYLSTDMISLSQSLDYSDKYHWTFEIFNYFVDKFLSEGYSVIADTNADKYKIRKEYYDIAEIRNAVPYVFWVKTDFNLLKKRQNERRKKDDHRLRKEYLYIHTIEELEKYKNDIEEPGVDEDIYIIDGSKDLSIQLDEWDKKRVQNNK